MDEILRGPRVLLGDLLWDGASWQRGRGIVLAPDGAVLAVRPPRDGDSVERFPGRALFPGFVNAHSHAFQRALRGGAQELESGRCADTFWSWREQMVRAVEALDSRRLRAISAMCYMEMLKAGWTSVAEFHYLHHLGEAEVLEAARCAGIRMTLIRTAYLRAGHEQEPLPGQRCLIETLEAFLERCVEMARHLPAVGRQRWGVGAHSVRTVDRAGLERVGAFARDRGVPFHIHVAEQEREVAECRREHGRGPVDLLLDLGLLDARATLVHGNHLSVQELDALSGTGATVCVCPTTEGDLGDGPSVAVECRRRGVALSVGSDSQTVIDPFAELRAVEYLERTLRRRRICLSPVEDLLRMATEGGRSAMGLPVGRLIPGSPADLVALDLEHDTLLAAREEALIPSIVLSGSPSLVRDVWVGGERVVEGGRHVREDSIREEFTSTMKALWS